MVMEPSSPQAVSDGWCIGSKSAVAANETANVSIRLWKIYKSDWKSAKAMEVMNIL